ncbi:DUF1877 family protein [Moraxella osloensis]|mgnify:CR=1 FL=1|uniref:DUF1877 family protein n=1 Tax=Faucicola osloensis TaxID=34062 RepID=A0A2D2LV96_FAUOS|nr:DUF1877 family protein [Moraxella osloensis]ATR78961.1 hypothetical protein NP7_06665 [Moraxella osloensis]
MGLYASYETISDEQIVIYKQSIIGDFWYDFSSEFRCDLFKFWDKLHYILTGYLTFDLENPTVEQALLHQAIMGNKTLNEDDFIDFDSENLGDDIIEPISFNDATKVQQISQVLNQVDIQKKLLQNPPENLLNLEVYPYFDEGEDLNQFTQDTIEFFENLKQFYQKASDHQLNVITHLG